MSLMLIAALQAAAPPQAPEGVARSDFDLAQTRPAGRDRLSLEATRGCRPSGSEEIVVCGRPPVREDFPMEEMEREYAVDPIVAETRIGGNMTGRVFVDSATLGRGEVSQRVMVGVRLPF